MQVWTGAGRYGLADSQAYAVHRRYSDGHLWGSWRYRVMRMTGDKIDARPVLSSHGLPELVGIELSPGVPGCDVVVPDGLEVLIEFVEGNRALPRIVAFAGHDQSTWTPTRLTLDADGIELGDGATNEVALHNLVEDELLSLGNTIKNVTPVPNDGGAAIIAAVNALIVGGWPGSTAADKVKAE